MNTATSKQVLLLVVTALLFIGCDNSDNNDVIVLSKKYFNERFSITYPEDWVCSDSMWCPRDGLSSVSFFPPMKDNKVDSSHWVECTLEFVRMSLDTPKEAAVLYSMLESMNPDPSYIKTVETKDSIYVGKQPAFLMVHYYRRGEDTLVYRQYICHQKVPGFTYYFGNYYIKKYENKYRPMGDSIISTVSLH